MFFKKNKQVDPKFRFDGKFGIYMVWEYLNLYEQRYGPWYFGAMNLEYLNPTPYNVYYYYQATEEGQSCLENLILELMHSKFKNK